MKTFLHLLAVASVIAVTVSSCLPAMRSSRAPSQTAEPTRSAPSSQQTPKPTGSHEKAPGTQPAVTPDQKAPGIPDAASLEGLPSLDQRPEINQAALDFAAHVPNVKYVKTCFSKLYGGWYLILYVTRGKRTSLQQYLWNPKSKEWEIVYILKEIPEDQVEYHVKGEVGDEKCFVLKR